MGDAQLTDALRLVGGDPSGNKRVKRKLLFLLTAWREQYKDDLPMAYFANLYKHCRVSDRKHHDELYNLLGSPNVQEDLRRAEKVKAKEEKRAAKERARAEEEKRAANSRTRRAPFDFARVSLLWYPTRR